MLGQRITLRRGSRDDGEKPFWISFADLMTAMMVLFLVALSVALAQSKAETAKAEAARTQAIEAQVRAQATQVKLDKALADLEEEKRRRNQKRDIYKAQIDAFLDQVAKIVRRHDGVVLDRERHVINFGPRAQFDSGKHDLKLEQANALRRLVPELLVSIQRETDQGSGWLKRVIVEGFTDDTGDYLLNLNLSLQRSQQVLCALLAREWPIYVVAPRPVPAPVSPAWGIAQNPPQQPVSPPVQIRYGKLDPISEYEERMIRSLFFVGGYSSNSQKTSRDESRRIEMRIEFFQLDDERAQPPTVRGEVGKCALGGR
jgi:outer membrane protein OmpA-like peptidoglycan-associated protein